MKLFALALLTTVGLTAACGSAVLGGGDDTGYATSAVETSAAPDPEAPSATSSATATATPEPTATSVPAQTISDDKCGGSLEGCFSYDEMDEYLGDIIPMVQQYFETAFPDVPDPEVVYIPDGRAARSYCGVSDSEAYEYCSGDQTIYIGQDLLWAFYNQAGDAAPAVALAHEWGHHLQFSEGVDYDGRSQAGAIAFENQADCISGAWAQYANDQGWLETGDDLSDIETLMEFIGARESRARDHGTTPERVEAFNSSYEDGISACNAYFPNSLVG
jgi:predicted metalloprotease